MVTIVNYKEDAEKTSRKLPLCPKCKVELAFRVRRGFLFKKLLSWTPVRRFYCYKCKKKHYVWN